MQRSSIVLLVIFFSCTSSIAQHTGGRPNAELVKAAEKQAKSFASESREKSLALGFAEFKRSVFKEPFPGGVYIVNGDTPIGNDDDLRDFYIKEIAANWPTAKFGILLSLPSPELIVDAPNGKPNYWDNITKKNLTYCVSSTFGTRHQDVVGALKPAAAAWEAVSDVRYRHVPALDNACNSSTLNVVFDVRPVDVGGKYLARAFFPRSPRAERNVLIDESAFNLVSGKLTLQGILRHELGHVLSFRHEHTRPEAGKCFEDKDWVPVSDYDAFSVMHYPQCNGLGDWSLTLTDKDKVGSACLYGPATSFVLDPAKCRML
jgi:Matrixin